MNPVFLNAPHPSCLDTAGSIDAARALARLLLVGVALMFFALWLAPWQQNVTGSGRVIAYAPLERQQTLEAPVAGRVMDWFVQEGDHVEEGDLIVELSDNDPHILQRLERERGTIEAQIDASILAIAVAEAKIASLEGARSAAMTGAGLERMIAEDRRDGAHRALDAAKAAHATASLNLERQQRLHGKGLASTRTLELAELKLETTQANLDRAKATVSAAKRKVKAMAADRDGKGSSAQAKIEGARASLQSARSSKAKAEGELAKIDVRMSRQSTMRVAAPRAGMVFRLVAKQGGEVVKQGDPLVVLVPDTNDRAVELWVDGNDAPLITAGRHVRQI
ncbi:MAG: HlyD family efflux transporter periplasmic adaptor subunit, partial [Deltaproteobacteria bacterium]|nr:HlyD family efflux transporter periplasmic adaptor subunit [Deltaproteobacteria bacterium]